MESMDQFLDKADAYTSSRMSEEDTRAFENAIATGGEWNEAWTLYQQAKASIEVEAEANLKQKWNREYMASREPKIRRLSPLLWLVAAGIAMLAAFAFWQMRGDSFTAEELYAMNTEKLQLSLGQRGTQGAEMRFAEANELLNDGKYQESTAILEALLQDTAFKRTDFARLHLGICYLQTGQEEKAEVLFDQVSSESAFRYDAIWYKALLDLKNGNIVNAKTQLLFLQKESRSYEKPASDLLLKLQDVK